MSSIFISLIRSALGTALNGQPKDDYVKWVNYPFHFEFGLGPVVSDLSDEQIQGLFEPLGYEVGVEYGETDYASGRRFFDNTTEAEIVLKLNEELVNKGYFEKYKTDYVLLDAEIMPWNLKAKELISGQYAHVAENAILDRLKLKEKLDAVAGDNEDLDRWLEEVTGKLDNAKTFKEVFQKYCWDTDGTKKGIRGIWQ